MIEWRIPAAGPGGPPADMPGELGVRWYLCDEDCRQPPTEARLELNLDDGTLWIFAPAPMRLDRVARRFTLEFSALLGEQLDRRLDRPQIVPRWQRERWDRLLRRMEPAFRPIRVAASAA